MAEPEPPLAPQVLGRVVGLHLSSSFMGRVAWDFGIFYLVIDARCFIPDLLYYAFSFYQVYKVKYCVFITYKYMNLREMVSLWLFFHR